MHDTTPPFALYNPALLPPEVLLSEFTARRPLLRRVLDIVRDNAPGQPPQHVLVVGPRGMGKTTLLCAIAASITTREADLRQRWQPVIFDEESRRIGDLADFWLECIRQWEAATEPKLSPSARLDALLDRSGADLEDRARETFLQLVDAAGRRALLLIDNFNDVLRAVDGAEAHMRLRSFLMADSRVMIVGAATRWFDEVANVDRPFFEFFRSFELHALNLTEMRECLAGVAEARGDQRVLDALARHPRSIEALHILTGGNPRLIRTFYRLLNEGLHVDLRQQLERLIDDYTPYLKAILDALPGQQQRVLDAIALHWNPCDVATVARLTRLPSNQVSAQIRALSKAGLVSEVPAIGTQKKKAYLLTDRFSNIHYLMRHGRAGQLRLHWFVMTLRVLFDDERFAEAAARTVRLTAGRGEEAAGDALSLAHAAMECSGSEEARRRLFDRMAGSWEFDREIDVAFAEKLCREAIERNPKDALAHHKWGRLLAVHVDRFVEAEIAFRKAIELDPNLALPWNGLGNLLTDKLGRHEEAETAFRMAIELEPKFTMHWNNLGNALTELGRHEEAEAAYRKAIDLDPKGAWPWNGLGNLLNDLGKHMEAQTAYRKAIELDPKYGAPWNGLGNLLTQKFGRHEEAETAYRKAIELDPNDAMPWNNLGVLLTNELGRHAEAEAAYRKAIEFDPKSVWPWNNLGNLLSDKLGRHEEAEAAYRKAIELDPKDAWPWNGLGNLLTHTLSRHEEAEAAYRKAIELDPKSAAPWNNLGNLLADKLGRHAEAEATYRNAIELDPKKAKAHSNLARHLAKVEKTTKAKPEAVAGFRLDPQDRWTRWVFRDLCFDDTPSLNVVLPEVSLWCSQHPEAKDVVSFLVDAWFAYAQVTSPAEALRMLQAQPEAAQLVFEAVSDAFLAHADRDHLHRLAPERRAPVMKLLERLGT